MLSDFNVMNNSTTHFALLKEREIREESREGERE